MSNKPDYKKKAAEKVTEDLILVEEEGQVYVKAGTLERLVQRVTTDEYADINFMLQFLLTYRSFTTHDGLLAELIKRYDEAVPGGPGRERVEREAGEDSPARGQSAAHVGDEALGRL
jgi:hypothetical protein